MTTKKTKGVRSDTNIIKERNKRFILDEFDTKWEGKTKEELFMSEMEHYINDREPRKTTSYKAVRNMLEDATLGNPYYVNRAEYLGSIGLKKYKDIDKLTDRQLAEADELYQHILARDGAKLYREIRSGNYEKTGAKKTSARRK